MKQCREWRVELAVWLSREQFGWAEDEKADWCTRGHSSAGTQHHSRNFYSHLKNTLRRKNANNKTSPFHVFFEEREWEKGGGKSLLFNEIQIPNVPVKQQAEMNLESEKRRSSDIPGSVQGDEQRNRETGSVVIVNLKTHNKALTESLYAQVTWSEKAMNKSININFAQLTSNFFFFLRLGN